MAGGNNNKDILIRVRADIQKALKDIDGLEKELEDTGEAGKKAGDGVSRADKSIQFLTRAAGAYLSLQFAKQVFLQADAMQALATRVRTATKDTGDFDRVWSSLLSTSVDSGAQMESIVGLFQNLSRAAPELEATNAEMLTLTELVSQLGVIGGSSQAAMSAGLTQFSQMLSGNVARAEEFNSLLENVPELAKRIATGMGKTTGELRNSVIAGEVLSKDVFQALVKQSDEINREFADIPPTFERAWSSAISAVSGRLQKMDEELGTTRVWAQLLQEFALHVQPDSVETEQGQRVKALFDRERELLDRIQEFEGIEGPFAQSNLADLEARLKAVRGELEAIRKERETAAQTGDDDDIAAGLKVDPETEKAILELTKKFRDQAATLGLNNEAVAKYRTELGDLKGASDEQKQSLIEAAQALDRKAEAQKAAQEADRNKAADDGVLKALEKEIQLLGMNERAQAQFEAVARLSTDATDEQRESVRKLAGALYDLEQATPVKQFAELEGEGRRALDILSQNVQRVQSEVNAGLRSELSGRQEIIRLQQETAASLERDVLPGLVELAKTMGPEAEDGVRRVIASIEQLKRQGNAAVAELRSGMEGAFSTFVQSSLRDIDKVEEAFSALGEAILDTIYKIIADRLAMMFIDWLMGALGFGMPAGGGTETRQGRTYQTTVAHTGAVVGTGEGSKRPASAALFAGAPKFHTGGMIGADEVPIIAKRGEGVFTPAQMKALAPVGSQGTIVNVINNSGEKTETRRSRGSNGEEIIDVVVGRVAADISRGGGEVDRAIQNSYGVARVGR